MDKDYSNKALQIFDYALANEVLRSDSFERAPCGGAKIMLQNSLTTLNGELHQQRRSAALERFSPQFFGSYQKIRFRALVRQTIVAFSSNELIDLVELAKSVFIHAAADLAGIDVRKNTFQSPSQLIKIADAFWSAATVTRSHKDHDEIVEEAALALKVFERCFVGPAIEQREMLIGQKRNEFGDNKKLPRDVLTALLQSRDESQMSHTNLVQNMAHFLIFSYMSSVNAAVFALHEILQLQCQDSVVSQRLGKNRFLLRCIQESMRLHPTAPVYWGLVTQPIKLPGMPWLKEGDYIVVDINKANRDSAVFGKDAADFNPDRRVPAGIARYGLTLGEGAHKCPVGALILSDENTVGDEGPITEQQGLLHVFVEALVNLGVSVDSENIPKMAADTERESWEYYPIQLK
jgi:cytochrome P450